MNKAIHDILDRAEEYADRKGDPTLRDELKVLETTVAKEFTTIESELKRCRELITILLSAAQQDSDTILALRRELEELRKPVEPTVDRIIGTYGGHVRRVKRGFLDIVVQELSVSGLWLDRMTFNEMSDDYAESGSRSYASSLMISLAQKGIK